MDMIDVIKFILSVDSLTVAIPIGVALIGSIVGILFFKKKRKKK